MVASIATVNAVLEAEYGPIIRRWNEQAITSLWPALPLPAEERDRLLEWIRTAPLADVARATFPDG